jgi:ATP-binding cassette, subfamily B, bacterial MsbA
MNDFRRLLPFVRRYAGLLSASLILLVFAGLFEVLTTALAIPLFDEVLIPSAHPVAAQTAVTAAPAAAGQGVAAAPAAVPAGERTKLDFLRHSLSLLPGSKISQLSLALVALTLFKCLALYYSNYWMSHVGQGVVMDLRNDLYDHVLRQSMGFFALNSTGRLMSSMSSDVEQVQEAVSTSVAELFRESVLLVALVVWILYIDWRLAAVSLLIAPGALTLTLSMGRRIRRVSLKSRENIATLNDRLQQTISGIRVVKSFVTEDHEKGRFHKSAGTLFKSNMRAARILFLNSPLMELLGVVSFVPLLYYAHSRIEAGTLTFGLFGGSLFSLFRMYDPIRKLSRLHIQFQRAFASASRIMDIFDTHIEIQDRPGARILDGFRDSVEFRDVQFQYRDASGGNHVLHDINLKAGKRQVTALVGSSGSGKSTLVSLIPRFYDVASGAVLIDGVDVREFTQASLRAAIAIVSQDTFLFNDTVRHNIAYGETDASEERIVAAAKAALAHDFIMALPSQYDTVIGERGQRLSGGERQRLSIARAVLRNAPILILDEATSALDSESEQLVQKALLNLMQDRTTFVIAHRLSTIRNADVIVVLDRGRIREVGTHESLLEANGLYSRFSRLQAQEPVDAVPVPEATGAAHGTAVGPRPPTGKTR